MQSQKIRSTAYASFSVFGLLFTYITGAIFIFISFILDPILRCLHRRKSYKQYEYLEWCTNDKMQLHRLAHTSKATTERWTKCTSSIPVTESNVLLAGLDISNLKVPKIRCTAEPMKNTLRIEEDDHQSHTQPTNVTTVSSGDTLQSPGNVPGTSAEENNSEPGDGHHSQRESTEQQTDDFGGRQRVDDTAPHEVNITADEGIPQDSARLSGTGETGVDTIARADGSTAHEKTNTSQGDSTPIKQNALAG